MASGGGGKAAERLGGGPVGGGCLVPPLCSCLTRVRPGPLSVLYGGCGNKEAVEEEEEEVVVVVAEAGRDSAGSMGSCFSGVPV